MMRPANEIKIGALYGRVSVVDAAEVEHGSLEQQAHMGRALAEHLSAGVSKHHLKHILIEEKPVSGGTTNRPQYQILLDLIRSRKIDFVVAKEISRLSRSLSDFCNFMELCKKNGVAVHIRDLNVDPSSPIGEMMFKMVATLAEFERNMTRKRVKDGTVSAMLNNAKINGGSLPLGFDPKPEHKGFWQPNPEELKQVEFLMKTFVETGSLKSTLEEAKRFGIKNKRRNAFNHNTLKHLLRNRKYIGKMDVKFGPNESDVKCVELLHGEVVDKALFEAVQEKWKMHEGRRATFNRMGTRVYLLTGLLEFADGTPFKGVSATSGSGERRYYYRNSRHELSVDAIRLERSVFAAFKRSFENDRELASHVSQLESGRSSRLELVTNQLRLAQAELKQLSADEEGLVKGIAAAIDADKTRIALQLLEETLKERGMRKPNLEGKVADLAKERDRLATTTYDRKRIRTGLSALFAGMPKADPQKQKEFLRATFKKIQIDRDHRVLLVWRVPHFI